MSSVQYSYCTSEKFVGYMWFYQCKQHCLNMGSSCHGIVYPRNHETWCYWCPSAQQDYYHNGDYWDLTVCVWECLVIFSQTYQKSRQILFEMILPYRSYAIVTAWLVILPMLPILQSITGLLINFYFTNCVGFKSFVHVYVLRLVIFEGSVLGWR